MLQKPAVKWSLIFIGVIVVILLLVLGGLKYAVYRNEQKLEATMNKIDIPKGWVLVEEQHGGNSLCLDVCSFYYKEFETNRDQASILSHFKDLNSLQNIDKFNNKCNPDKLDYLNCQLLFSKNGYEVSVLLPKVSVNKDKQTEKSLVKVHIEQIP